MESTVEQPCPICFSEKGLTMIAHSSEIPYFGEHTQLTILCPSCGWRHTDFIPAEGKKPGAWSLDIDDANMLTVRIIRSSSCTVKINDLGLLNYVNYLGKLYGEKKDKIFKESDIFVFPTYYKNEAFPLVILESFMYGVPVITTNEGGISDIVRNEINGLIIKKESSYDAFRAIQKLVNEPRLYEKISLNCINDFNNKYTKEIFDDRIYGILKMIVNE